MCGWSKLGSYSRFVLYPQQPRFCLDSPDNGLQVLVDCLTLSSFTFCYVSFPGKSLEGQLAQLGSKCTGVVICRSSPSQKAAVVRIMREFELKQVQMGLGGPILRFFRKQKGAIKVRGILETSWITASLHSFMIQIDCELACIL